jgi:hypothetical protein
LEKGENDMNYVSTNNTELKESVATLLGIGKSQIQKINFSVSYTQNRKMSIVIIEVYPSPTIQAIFLFYTRGLKLHDTICYRSKRSFRVNRSNKSLQHIDRITKYLSERIPQFNPMTPRKIEEESDEEERLNRKDQQIQSLKDRNRVEKEINRSHFPSLG